MSAYADLLAEETRRLATTAAQAEERVLVEFRRDHGRWPEFVWSETRTEATPEGGLRVVVNAYAGDLVPGGVRYARRSGVLNAREVTE